MSECLGLSRVLHAEYNHLYPEAPLPPEIADDLPKVIAALHAKERSALCLSGGGIRSATFALGVIQGLAGLGRSAADSVLAKLDYLSTVSGGGYIGSWLSGWAERKGGIQPVVEELRTPTGDPLRPEPQPVHHLREYSNYLTPKLGLLSADTWTFAGTYMRNMTLMWLVLVPLFLGVLALPRLFIGLIVGLPREDALPLIRDIAVVLLAWALGFLAFTRPVGKIPPPKRWIYTNGGFQILCLLPLCLVAAALVIGHAWKGISALELLGMKAMAAVIVVSSAAAVLSSLVYSVRYWRANSYEERDDVRAGTRLSLYTFRKQLLEIAVAAVSGALFGALIYLFLQSFERGDGQTFSLMQAPDMLAWLNGYPPQISQSLAASYVVFGVPLILLALLLQSAVFVGGTSWYNEDFDREWWGRAAAWVFIAGIGWIVLTATVIYGPVALCLAPRSLSAVGGVSGLIAVLLGKSGKTGSNKKSKEEETTAGKSFNVLLAVVVPLFVLVLLAALSLGTTVGMRKWLERDDPTIARPADARELAILRSSTWSYEQKQPPVAVKPLGPVQRSLKTTSHPAVEAEELAGLDHLYVLEKTPWWKSLIVVLGSLLLSLLASWLIGVNRFSMHALYRDRLIRAYLGASNVDRAPNPFTGFDPHDNIPMSRLRKLTRPMHVVNMTLNLVGGKDLAWQERKAESFTASPLCCGNLNLGYRPSDEYAGPRGMTLGTALAISGAAASPNMGYHSSSALAFLMTFFNVRLGWWLGNPGRPGNDTYKYRNPRTSLRPLLAEVFGNTDAQHPYVYLSDGGHFENLGFYEMVLRRVRRIVISDAGADQGFVFDDLGNAIRKIYIDFGIRVRIDRMGLFPRSLDPGKRDNPRYCATGRIFYSDADGPEAPVGEFVYIKPVFYGSEPQDIYNYALTNATFPHETTGDQWFSESQFESYRALGAYTVTQICGKRDLSDVNTVAELIEAAQEYAK